MTELPQIGSVYNNAAVGPIAARNAAANLKQTSSPLAISHNPESPRLTKEQITGERGERLVKNWLNALNQKPNISYEVRIISTHHKKAGYDIQIHDQTTGERICIEVKTQMPGSAASNEITLTANEKSKADYYTKQGMRYYIAHVTNLDEHQETGNIRFYNYTNDELRISPREYRIKFDPKFADESRELKLEEPMQNALRELIPTKQTSEKVVKPGLKANSIARLSQAISKVVDTNTQIHGCTDEHQVLRLLLEEHDILRAVGKLVTELEPQEDPDSATNTKQVSEEESDNKIAKAIKQYLLNDADFRETIYQEIKNVFPQGDIYQAEFNDQADLKFGNSKDASTCLVDLNINFKNTNAPSQRVSAAKIKRIKDSTRQAGQHYFCFNLNLDITGGKIDLHRYRIEKDGDLSRKLGTELQKEGQNFKQLEVSKYRVTLPGIDDNHQITKESATNASTKLTQTGIVTKTRTPKTAAPVKRKTKARSELEKIELRNYQRKELRNLENVLRADQSNHQLKSESGSIDVNSTLLLGHSGTGKTSILAKFILDKLRNNPNEKFLITLPPHQFPLFQEALLKQCQDQREKDQIASLISHLNSQNPEDIQADNFKTNFPDLQGKNIFLLSTANPAFFNYQNDEINIPQELIDALQIEEIDNFIIDNAHSLSNDNDGDGNEVRTILLKLLQARKDKMAGTSRANLIGATSPFYHTVESDDDISQKEKEELFTDNFLSFFPAKSWLRMPGLAELIEPHKLKQAKTIDIIEIDARKNDTASVSLKTYTGEEQSGAIVNQAVKVKRGDDYQETDLNDEIVARYHQSMVANGYKKVVILCHSHPQIQLLKDKFGSATNVIELRKNNVSDALKRFEASEGKTVLLINASQHQGGIYPQGVEGLIISEMTSKSHKFARMMGIAHAMHDESACNETPIIYVHCPYAEKAGKVFLNQESIKDKSIQDAEANGGGGVNDGEVNITNIELSDAYHTSWQEHLRASLGISGDELFTKEIGPIIEGFIAQLRKEGQTQIDLESNRIIKEIIEGNRINHKIFRKFIEFIGLNLDQTISAYPLLTGIYPRKQDPADMPGIEEARLIFNVDNICPFEITTGQYEVSDREIKDFLDYELENYGVSLKQLTKVVGINETDLDLKLSSYLDEANFDTNPGQMQQLNSQIKRLITTALIMDRIWGLNPELFYNSIYPNGQIPVRINYADGRAGLEDLDTKTFTNWYA